MRIAILMTNTDETAFAQRHAKDGEKFAALLHRVRPNWSFDVFSVKDGVFPSDISGWDGVMITGSPASVHDGADWIARLESLIRAFHHLGTPMFGACFGHQVIATALGGVVGPNPDGWVMGTVTTSFVEASQAVAFYAAHKEQVSVLPEGAVIVAETPGCRAAGFAIGNHVLTTQYHPEMSKSFIAALLEELREDLGDTVTDQAEASLATEVETDELAEWIADFYESAQVSCG